GWGLYHGAFLIFERMGFGKLLEKSKVLSRIYCMIVVVIGWVFFRVDSVSTGLRVIERMLMPWKYQTSAVAIGTLMSEQTVLACVIGVIGCGILQKIFTCRKLSGFTARWKNSLPEAIYCGLVLFYCILLLANNTYNPFIYFRF
ncbi:MAG: MBOAT family protein, partial [Butyrivibrio sp.]|nr:MBOAT family protein [Butyrivibrio sp.]